MSGGEYQYMYYKVEDIYCNRMHDAEMNELIKDLVPILKAVEWWQSGDTEREAYQEELDKFKNKWFRTSREIRLKNIVVLECEKLKEDLLKVL